MSKTSKKISVFFDTNSYRQIVLNKSGEELIEFSKKILALEQKKNIKPITTLTVLLELSANLVEGEKGFNYENCLNSLRFATNHCFDPEKNRIRISSLPFLQISAMLFGALPIDFEKQEKRFSSQFELFKPFDNHPNISQDFYEFIKSTLTKQEQEFSNNIIGLINAANYGIEQIHPKMETKIRKRKLIEYFRSDAYAQHLSEQIAKIVSNQLQVKLSDEELQKRAFFLRTELPISSAFFQWILIEIIKKDIDMTSKNSKTRRWNWLWDYQISFLISQSTIEKGEMILVTSDKEMIQILEQNGLGLNVMKIDNYLELIND